MKPASTLPLNDTGRLIDATLEQLSRVRPASGFEGRMAAHIAASASSPKVLRFPFPTRIGATAAAAALAAVAILAVSNDHKARRISLPPALHLSSPSFGTAEGMRVPTQTVHPTVRPRAVISRSKGRAVITPTQARKNHANAVPQTPSVAPESTGSGSSPSQP